MTGSRTLALHSDVYSLAMLAGGPRRAVDTAAVALLESGRIMVSPISGELSVVEGRRRSAVEAAVVDAIAVHGHRSIETVRWRLESDDRLAVLADGLVRQGLLHPVRTGLRRRYWRLALTREGRRTLSELRADPPSEDVPGSPSAVLVALCGPSRMADPVLRAAAFQSPSRPNPQRSGSLLARRADRLPVGSGHQTQWTQGSGFFGGGGFDGGGGGCGGDGGGGGC